MITTPHRRHGRSLQSNGRGRCDIGLEQRLKGARHLPQGKDPRVQSVLEVLAGHDSHEVAEHWSVAEVLLQRWVTDFVEAGAAQVTNRPTERAARQRDRFLSRFMSGLRHELDSAKQSADRIHDSRDDPQAVARDLLELNASLDALDDHAQDVEFLTAAMLGRIQLVRRHVQIVDLARGLGADKFVAGANREVLVDPVLFSRVLRDVWAAAATTEPGTSDVHLEVEHVRVWHEFRIIRFGSPITPAVMQAMFDPFEAGDPAIDVSLGLYLARALTVAHGGTLGVAQDDARTCFWIRIPSEEWIPEGP